MPRSSLRLVPVALALTLGACSGGDAPVDPGPDDSGSPPAPAYTLTAVGDVTRSATGLAFSFYQRNGFTETTTSNGVSQRDSSDVTLVMLSPDGAGGLRVYLGLIGQPAVGTYRVRAVGNRLGTRPEFYGGYVALDADSSFQDYSAATGTVTVTAVLPALRGTFAFHSASVVRWPANAAPGTSVRSTPASADFSGSFVAPQRVQ
jgi:hypothetical protein